MKKFIFLFYVLLQISLTSKSQVKVSDFYKLVFYQDNNEFGFYPEPDTINSNLTISNFAKNMYGYNIYMYTNYSKAEKLFDSLSALLPDTNKIILEHIEILDGDETFKKIFFSTLHRKQIPAIDIDSIINIVSKFFYVHYTNGNALAHLCTMINGINEMQQTEFSPFYNAFSFMVLYNESSFSKFKKVLEPYNNELNNKSSDKRVSEIKNNVYATVLKDPEIREMIINEYERKKEYLNFDITF